MTKFNQIQKQLIEHARNSFILSVDRRFGIVCMIYPQNTLILKGDEANNFIDEADESCQKYTDEIFEDNDYLIAYPYCNYWI